MSGVQPTGLSFTLGHLRLKSGMTVEEAASISGYTVEYLTNVESGRREPSITTIHKLSTTYARRIAGEDLAPAAAEEEPKRERETRECLTPACLSAEHEYVDGVMDDECRSLAIGSDPPFNEQFYVVACLDEETDTWEAFANVDLDEVSGVDGLVAVERLALAYRAVHQHCEQLNQLERSTP